MKKNLIKVTVVLSVIFGFTKNIFAQGAVGLDAASSELTTYIDPLGNMLMIVGALVGLIGGIRVYIKWNSGDQDVQKSLMGWLGSCIFLVVSGIVIRAFFGV